MQTPEVDGVMIHVDVGRGYLMPAGGCRSRMGYPGAVEGVGEAFAHPSTRKVREVGATMAVRQHIGICGVVCASGAGRPQNEPT